jgi:photosystem II stability/assembly factor-like uncharacterized protein
MHPAVAGLSLAIALAAGSCAAATADPSDLPSEPAKLASHSLLLGIATAGPRLISVGDHGHILASDDAGRSWTQADTPTQALLTAVCFADARQGIAVGHDEVILTTADAGRTWKRTHFAPQAQQPLLGVWCGAAGRAVAVGAYGVCFVSEDAGATWTEQKIDVPGTKTAAGEIGGGYHLNAIAADTAGRLYVAAEAGHLYRSDDGGRTWKDMPSGYAGSLFGVLPVAGDVVLAFGLRGTLLRSENAGATWRTIATGTDAALDGAALLGDGTVAVAGLSGVVLVSRDGGLSFSLLQQDDRKGLSGVAGAGRHSLVVVGEAGARVIREPGQ